jgi:uncharacterized protein YdhG (YjbR/CyaY superfamily)
MATVKAKDIDEYISGFPEETQKVLEQIRSSIRKAAPGTRETISYAIPTFKLNDTYLVYFAGYKNHVSLYPVPKADEDYRREIEPYRSGKGTLQFLLDEPLPLRLITKTVKLLHKENLERAKKK